jgi:stage V sporulation protein G
MEITEVRIKLMEESEDRLRAFCSITFDDSFVVRDLKIIDGTSGPFVAMPSRKLTGRCGRCGFKNHLRSNHCNQCGSKLRVRLDNRDEESSPNKLYADIAHPINQESRDQIQSAVLAEYKHELLRSTEPDYVSRYDDDYTESAQRTSEISDVDGSENSSATKEVDGDLDGDLVRDPDGTTSSDVHPAASDSPAAKLPPPAPHFDSAPKRASVEDKDDDDSFGAGIL